LAQRTEGFLAYILRPVLQIWRRSSSSVSKCPRSLATVRHSAIEPRPSCASRRAASLCASGCRKRYPLALLLYRRRGRLSHLPRPLAFAHHGIVSSQLRYLANREASIRIVIAISDSPQKSAPSSPMSGTSLAVVGSFLGAASDFFGAASAVSTGGVG